MKGLNNKVLIITLILLVTAFVLTKVLRSPSLESNIDIDLFKIDTAKITAIRLYPAVANRNEIQLVKEGEDWNVTYNNKTANVETSRVKDLVRSIAQIKVERIVSRKKENWDDYNVNDTTATQVVALNGTDELLKFYIGKQNGPSAYTRLDDKDEVYEISGLLPSSVDKKFSDWRDKSFLRTDRDAIKRISLNYPADSGFVAEKRDNIWMIANEKADSASMESYLNKLRSKDIGSFADAFEPSANPDVVLTIESGTGPAVTIQGWKQSFDQWILSSSRQPDTYFADEGPVVAKELFPSEKSLLE